MSKQNESKPQLIKIYEKLQTRKLISAYGGVGSIIESSKGALMVRPFDKWKAFEKEKWKKVEVPEVHDTLLIAKLKKIFPLLEKLVSPPVNATDRFGNDNSPNSKEDVGAVDYFPKWMYCTKCNRFDKIENWKKNWHLATKNDFGDDILKQKRFFHYKSEKPICYNCYKNEKISIELEQVRFILSAPNGNIKDIPWEKWTMREKIENEGNDNSEEGSIRLHDKCCDDQELQYIISEDFADFAGIRIKCINKNCPTKGKQVSLAGLFGLKQFPYDAQDEHNQFIKVFFKPIIRSSNGVYYPVLYSSLFLPIDLQSIKGADFQNIINAYNKGSSSSEILIGMKMFGKNYSIQQIEETIELVVNEGNLTEIQYRRREYNWVLENLNYSDTEYNALFLQTQSCNDLKEFHINNLFNVKKLKLTTVQTGYTRIAPIDRDVLIQEKIKYVKYDNRQVPLISKFTSEKGNQTPFLLAIENYGEGIFLTLDNEKLNRWYKKNQSNREFIEKLQILWNRWQESVEQGYSTKDKFSNEYHLTKFVLIHTLSHLLIKELEFLCGYPATSIGERLYVDAEYMSGFLLYTIAGAEGSYGGLSAQSSPENFKRLLESALYRAQDCASDPICLDSDGQGTGGLNFAACYACTLLPETSCEEYNVFLDRQLINDFMEK